MAEDAGSVKVELLNKTLHACKVRVVSVDGTAISGKDYRKVDMLVEF